MNQEPVVSIGITTFNRCDMLEASLRSALDQSYRNIEIIVSDNCSTDNTAEVVARYKDDPRIRYYRQEKNLGPYLNLNSCVSRATGVYWLWLADDDWIEPDAVATLVKRFADETVTMATCGTRVVDKSGRRIRTTSPLGVGAMDGESFVERRLRRQAGMYPSSEMFKLQVLREVGGYKVLYHCDLLMEIEAARKGRIYVEDAILCNYRLHGDNAVLSHQLALDIGIKSHAEVFRALQRLEFGPRLIRFARRRIRSDLIRLAAAYSALGYSDAQLLIRATLQEIGCTGKRWDLFLSLLNSYPTRKTWSAVKES